MPIMPDSGERRQGASAIMSQTATPARPLWVILLSAGCIVGMAMGLRQVMGLYLRPMTMDLGIGREPFSMAIALANLVWGAGAVASGAIADRFGAGRVAAACALTTIAGLMAMYAAQSGTGLLL